MSAGPTFRAAKSQHRQPSTSVRRRELPSLRPLKWATADSAQVWGNPAGVVRFRGGRLGEEVKPAAISRSAPDRADISPAARAVPTVPARTPAVSVRRCGMTAAQLAALGLTSPQYVGLAIFQDRTSTAPILLSGQGDVNINGSIYAASAARKVANRACKTSAINSTIFFAPAPSGSLAGL